MWTICRSIKNRYPFLPGPFFCRFRYIGWSKLILEDDFFVPKLVLNVWNETIKNIPIAVLNNLFKKQIFPTLVIDMPPQTIKD